MPAQVLSIDIETAPILAYVWALFDQNIGLNQIAKDWHLLAFSAKWLGNKEVIYESQQNVKPIENDKQMCKKIWKLFDEADIVIGQNGDRFDIPKIKTRLFYHKMNPPSPFKTIDTLKIAKNTFGFTSNKLEWTTQNYCDAKKDDHHRFPGFLLWRECLAGNPKAWIEMKKYNTQDTVSLEDYYLRLRPWTVKHPNLALYSTHNHSTCPKCDSANIQSRGFRYTQVGKYHCFQCNDCHGWSSERVPENSKDNRKLQLMN